MQVAYLPNNIFVASRFGRSRIPLSTFFFNSAAVGRSSNKARIQLFDLNKKHRRIFVRPQCDSRASLSSWPRARKGCPIICQCFIRCICLLCNYYNVGHIFSRWICWLFRIFCPSGGCLACSGPPLSEFGTSWSVPFSLSATFECHIDHARSSCEDSGSVP